MGPGAERGDQFITSGLRTRYPRLNKPADSRFIADAMLGRLARWLRLLGFDTLYYPDISDNDLLRTAMRDGRIILTRDSHFLKRRNLNNLFFLHSDDPVQQLVELVKDFHLEGFNLGRCDCCNGILEKIEDKGKIKNTVPEHVFLNKADFLKCRGCGKVYWEGTHIKRFRDMIRGIKWL